MQKQINPDKEDWGKNREEAMQQLERGIKLYPSLPDEAKCELLTMMQKLVAALAVGDVQVRFTDLLRRLVREEEEEREKR